MSYHLGDITTTFALMVDMALVLISEFKKKNAFYSVQHLGINIKCTHNAKFVHSVDPWGRGCFCVQVQM